MSSVHFDPSSWQHVHHPRIVKFSMYYLCVWFKVCFLLGDKQEPKFRSVMSAQKHSLQTRDLARFGIDFIYI